MLHNSNLLKLPWCFVCHTTPIWSKPEEEPPFYTTSEHHDNNSALLSDGIKEHTNANWLSHSWSSFQFSPLALFWGARGWPCVTPSSDGALHELMYIPGALQNPMRQSLPYLSSTNSTLQNCIQGHQKTLLYACFFHFPKIRWNNCAYRNNTPGVGCCTSQRR